MKQQEISAELWERIRPLLPAPKPASPRGGRPRIDDQLALNGIVYVLRTGIPWEELPQALGWGSGMTCWRRLQQWHEAGVWHGLHMLLLEQLRSHDALDYSRMCIDGSSVASPRGVRTPGRTPPTGGNSAPSAMC
jgi:transposase